MGHPHEELLPGFRLHDSSRFPNPYESLKSIITGAERNQFVL